MNFVDTHSHIYLEHFNDDIDQVIERALEQKVNKILLPNIDSESLPALNALSQKYPEICYPMMGLHPTSVNEKYLNELAIVEQELASGKYIAVGEIGIDLYWDKTFKEEQMDAFSRQIHLARKLDLPFIIHSRNSFDEVFQVLDKEKDGIYRGIFHAFSGSVEQGRRAIELGFKLGIGGVITYKKAGLDSTIKELGPDHLVLETDAPYLTPVPFRGKRNESAYVVHTAQKIADTCQRSIEEIAEITSNNAKYIFPGVL